MAKSLRSKVKRDFRSKKREAGIYAAAHAARLERLHAKLAATAARDVDGDLPVKGAEVVAEEDMPADNVSEAVVEGGEDSMRMDIAETSSKRISTHGPRASRREEWRLSKGLPARPRSRGMNRQGGVAARRKAGRSKRRR
ncbi:hypothetical protein E1B28_004648 [Marasmius oreades]|uniref:DUF2423 domain-containing protein n=1 Tax=Marasmius oreades TaxID=181124 RepID=A0A9P7UZ27_9AGAR|nr:uncharacterized protein E1B28_004648 [Marasmius oreades]KAG7097283.1 hypothetical protein E1B28_004648 [Marasmius oreades]